LADLCHQRDWSPTWSSLVPIQTGGSRPPVFCIHGAGGNVLLYRDLARHLGPDQPVYGLQARGLNGQEPFLTCIEDMANHYISEIKAVQPEGPYYLGGYCLGGTIAYEIAQQLSAIGEKVGLLALFETCNIQASAAVPSFMTRLYRFLQNINFHLANLATISGKGRMQFIRAKTRTAKRRFARSLRFAISRTFFTWRSGNGTALPHVRLTRINDRAQLKYEPVLYSGKIILFRPKMEFVGDEHPEFGWAGMAKEGLDVQVLPVYPRGMLVEPFVEILAKTLGKYLTEASSSPA